MSLLRELLLDKKILEAKEEVDEFLEAKGVEDGMIHQRLEFDKSVYTSEELVNDFLKAHYLDYGLTIEEDDKKYTVIFFDEIAFINDTMLSVEVRDGVMIIVGFLRPMTSENPLVFKTPGGKGTMKLSADLPYIIELATVVEGYHAAYGKVSLTTEHLKSFKKNFEDKVTGIDLSLDFDHETREAAGWLSEVFLSDDEQTLLGVVKWTPGGALALSNRDFRYFSPMFNLDWVHPHTGENHGATLLGGALVNNPFLKMDAIVGFSEKFNLKNGEKKMGDTILLSEHNNKVQALENQVNTLKLSVDKSKDLLESRKKEVEQLTEERDALKLEKETTQKNAEYDKLFSEQKINKAQLEKLKEGATMMEVLSLSVGMNPDPKGGNGGTPAPTVKLSAEDKAACVLLGITEEEYISANSMGGQ
jgi:phage I-like protein